MATEAELQRKEKNYRNQIAAKQRTINSEQAKIDRLEGEIERLRNAYNRLDDLEGGEAKDLKDKTKVKDATTGYDWRGNNKNKFDYKFDDEIYPNAKELKKYIDDLKDQINWEIYERKSQINSSEGLIGSCKNAINWLWTSIKNLWN